MITETKTFDEGSIYTAAVYMDSMDTVTTFKIAKALQKLLDAMGCMPAPEEVFLRNSSHSPEYAAEPSSNHLNVSFMDVPVSVGEGTYKMAIADGLNSLASWLIGGQGQVPSESVKLATVNLLKALKEAPSATVTAGSFAVLNCQGRLYISLLKLGCDEVFKEIPSFLLPDQAILAQNTSVSVAVATDRLAALEDRVVTSNVVSMASLRAMNTMKSQPVTGTAQVISLAKYLPH